MGQIRSEMARRQVHPSHVVVLLPYLQLLPEARSAWLQAQVNEPAHEPARALFFPRFETSQSWARSLGGVLPGADDLQLDAARDLLTAASLLSRAGLAEHQSLLAGRLMQAAWSLARVAAAVPVSARMRWGMDLATALGHGMEAPALALELAVARIALAWVANSSYPSDLIFSALPDLLVVVEGFQREPLACALRQSWPERVLSLALRQPVDLNPLQVDSGSLALHAAQDAEDEAQCAAACVLNQLAAGHCPVALVAQDRVLTRRVQALLSQRGVTLADETGWTLSTTRAAAALMSLLRACVWNVSTDAVLDWLKHAPAFAPGDVAQAEQNWRRLGLRDWCSVRADDALQAPVQAMRDGLQTGRDLSHWLADLRAALQSAGQWSGLLQDPAGQAVLDSLHLREGQQLEFADVSARMTQSQFLAWVSQTLDAARFTPLRADPSVPAQVVILPLSQLLGRALAAVVLPACDEVRLPTAPEPPGQWTAAQRALLGLASREQLADVARAGWRYALQFPQVEVLWRSSDGGERLMPSAFVQAEQLLQAQATAADPRVLRELSPQPGVMPHPRGDALPLTRLSSSAYEDLRRCPYRFFALRLLRLQESDELDSELDKRDFGNWLHLLLKRFHEAPNQAQATDLPARVALINTAAEEATAELGLSRSEFLPFAAAWPRVRAGYLDWLAAHEANGVKFAQAESWKETPLGALTLVGKIDRIDRLPGGSALVIDYKTEARASTAQRIKAPLEDTQLAFYAALLSDDTLAAAYVNVGEKDATRSYVQAEVVALRDQLLEAIASDLARIAGGAELRALGEGKACEFCVARGLCRKDFWSAR